MKFAVVIALLVATAAVFAAETAPSVEMDLNGAGRQWHLKVYKGDVYDRQPDRLTVTDEKTGKNLIEYISKDTSFFDDARLVSLDGYDHPLVLTEWLHGMHTVCLKIFDPETARGVVYKKCSDVKVEYEIKGDHISLPKGATTSGPAQWSPQKGETPAQSAGSM